MEKEMIPALFVLDASKVKTLEDVVMLLSAMNITTHEGMTGFETIKHLFRKA